MTNADPAKPIWLDYGLSIESVTSQMAVRGDENATQPAMADCDPRRCYPHNPNCVPVCTPQCGPSCSPCFPHGKCNPQLAPCRPNGGS